MVVLPHSVMYKLPKGTSLLNLTIDYVVNNLSKLSENELNIVGELPEHLRSRMLRKFTVSPYFWQKVDFKTILRTLTHSKVEHLDLTSCTVDDVILRIIQPCVNLRQLHLTRVGQHLITTQGLLELIPHLKNIYLLRMSNCDAVNDEVVLCITKHCQSISGLDVGTTKITDNSLIYLSKLKNLQWLTFSNTQISDVGIEYLVNGPSGSKIKELRIGQCPNITENILKSVACNCPAMEVLVFHNCRKVQDKNCFSFQEGSLKNLKQLNWTIDW